MGVYASIYEPNNGAVVVGGVNFAARHGFASDGDDNPYGDDYQLEFQEQYRVVGAPVWTTLAVVGGSGDTTYYGSALAAGNYERQVRVRGAYSNLWSAWSASAFFTVNTKPAVRTISAPASGATVDRYATISWDALAGATDYEVQVLTASKPQGDTSTAAVETIATGAGAVGSAVASFPSVGTRYVRVRVKANGLWSDFTATLQLNVSWAPPALPTIVATPSDPYALGMLHTLNITLTHPTPVPPQDPVARTVLEVRELGALEAVTLADVSTALTSYVFTSPAAKTYQLRATVYSADGTFAVGSWVTATAANTIKGVVIFDPADHPNTVRAYRLNDEGASDDVSHERTFVQYQGREFPVVEFGDATSRVITVDVLHSKGAGDVDALRALAARRTTLCYRDSKGRRAFGVLDVRPTEDTFYGFTTGIVFTQTDYLSETTTTVEPDYYGGAYA